MFFINLISHRKIRQYHLMQAEAQRIRPEHMAEQLTIKVGHGKKVTVNNFPIKTKIHFS